MGHAQSRAWPMWVFTILPIPFSTVHRYVGPHEMQRV